MEENNSCCGLDEIHYLKEILVNLENVKNSLQERIDEFPLTQYDHFSNLRREIDIKRETLLEKIFKNNEKYSFDEVNKLSSQLIKRVENIEEEFQKNFSLIKPKLIPQIDVSKERDNLRRALNPEILKQKISHYKRLFNDLEQRLLNFNLFEYDLKRNKLIAKQSLPIGTLDLHFDFIQTIDVDILNIITCSFEQKDLYLINLNTNSILNTYSSHLQGVECFVIHEQTKLISGSEDNTINVFDLSTGKRLNSLIGHTRKVWSLKLLQNQSLLASSSLDKTIIIWNLKSFKPLLTLKGHRESVFCLDYLMCCNQLLSGSDDSTIRMWDIKSGRCMKIIQGHTETIRCLKANIYKDLFASGSSDKTIRIWTSVGKCARVLRGHTDWISDLECSAIHLFSCSCDRSIRVWDLNSGNCIRTLIGHLDFVCCIQLNPKNTTQLISGSMDKCVKIWDIEDNQGKCVQTYQVENCVCRLEICGKV